jgi:hypothetical protein
MKENHMASEAQMTFKITGWNEETISELEEGGKLTRARVTKSYDGDLQGEGVVEYLMAHKPDGSASFVGYESVSCAVRERSGSLVFEHRGVFQGGTVNSTWTIVEDSGSGKLAGISGTVSFSAGHQEEYQVTLNYELE